MVVLQFLEYLVSYVQIQSQDLYQHYRILPYHTRVKLWCLLKDNFPTFKTEINKIKIIKYLIVAEIYCRSMSFIVKISFCKSKSEIMRLDYNRTHDTFNKAMLLNVEVEVK